MLRSIVTTSLLLLLAPDLRAQDDYASEPGDYDDPVVLHSEALAAELDGDADLARKLITRAYRSNPDDALIVFDYVRMTLGEPGADVEAFLERDARSTDEQLLRAYVLESRGERAAALDEIEAVLQSEPGRVEAQMLRRALGDSGPRSTVSARAQLVTSVDSNVSVLPDDAPSQKVGARIGIDGAVVVTTGRGPLSIDFGIGLRAATHLNDREDLQLYDPGVVEISSRAKITGDSSRFTLKLSGATTFLEGFDRQFLQEFDGRFDGMWQLGGGPVELGFYARGGFRDFRFGNAEGTAEDRDGPKVGGGLAGGWSNSMLSIRAAAGSQSELAGGDDQLQTGVDARLVVTFSMDDWLAQVGVVYQLRDYVDHSENRKDDRITPLAMVGYQIADDYSVRLSYVFIRNVSIPRFDYSRHIGQLSLGGRW